LGLASQEPRSAPPQKKLLREQALTKEDDAGEAFAEYERWSRERDRQCNLVGKDNVPLEELSSSEI